jgi:hypothetical protein
MRLLLLPLLLLFALPAAGQLLYRWKDDNGVTHYSDQPPTGRSYETRQIESAPAAANDDAADPGATGPGQDDEAGNEPVDDTDPIEPPATDSVADATPSAACLQVRANLRVFESSSAVSMDLDGDGVPEKLDDEARARELERTRELIGKHCGNT